MKQRAILGGLWLILLMVVSVGRWQVVSGAAASTFVVSTTVDMVDANVGDGVCETAPGNGICSLRAAVQEANMATVAATIVLPAGTYQLSLPGAGEDLSVSGDLDLLQGVTILGDGWQTTIIDGNQLEGVIDIKCLGGGYPYAGPDMAANCDNIPDIFLIEGVTIQNGRARSGSGIAQNFGYLILNESRVTGNVSTALAGAVHTVNSRFRAVASQFDNNDAVDVGSAIRGGDSQITLENSQVVSNLNRPAIYYVSGAMTVTQSSISNNDSVGLIAQTGALWVNDSVFVNNKSSGLQSFAPTTVISGTFVDNQGGGIYSNGNDLTVMDSYFANNERTTGGGLHILGGTGLLVNNRFDGNRGTEGGAVHVRGGSVVMRQSVLMNNEAFDAGGGIYVEGGAVMVENSTLSNNRAWVQGGGIYVTNSLSGAEGVVDLRFSTLYVNLVLNNNSNASVYVDDGRLDFRQTIVANYGEEANCAVGVTNSIVSQGYNVVDDFSCFAFAATDLEGVDPRLDSNLTDNGGGTLTHQLWADSPAIDWVAPVSVTVGVDQRGISRPQGYGGDVGAYEYVGSGVVTPTLSLVGTTAPEATLSWTYAVENCVFDLYVARTPYGSWSLGEGGIRDLMTVDVGVLVDGALNRYYLEAYGCGFSGTAVTEPVAGYTFGVVVGN
ncbi:MAG TPA: right-handed parallel beta-helix repeat-containing protein [Anaerolineae bacterium]|nr:right-handed parallel beta-helix repeat-containing protein [Anaerolineae bacterium]